MRFLPMLCLGLPLALLACSSSSTSTDTTDGGTTPTTGSGTDPCGLLTPSEIMAITGGTVGPGTRDQGSITCHWKISGASPAGTGSLDSLEVSYNSAMAYQAKDSPNNKGIPLIDVPELSADAYLLVVGDLFMKAGSGGLEVNLNIDKLSSLSDADKLAALKPLMIKLAKLILPRI